MNIIELCEMIDMPGEVTSKIRKWNSVKYREALEHYWIRIQNKSNWDTALDEIRKLLPDDSDGLNCLAFQLHTGLKTYQEYTKREIPLQIFIDTMGCFSRFVKEHHESYGTYGFDREWWTVRELSLNEFRLGELEYELICEAEDRSISVHIPSNARLDQLLRRESYAKAASFFSEYEKDYQDMKYYCESWILSPKLKEILATTSNIISFQNDFILDTYDLEDTGYMLWVFKNEALSLQDVPQNTSLQVKMKAYLQNGGKIGTGKGYLKKEMVYSRK